MKDVENRIYTMIRNALKAKYPDVKTTGITEDRPAKFPTVAIEITGRSTDRSWMTSAATAHPDVITVTITAMTTDGKAEAKALLETAEEPLYLHRFILSGLQAPRTDSTGVTRASNTYTAGFDGDFFYTR